MNIKKWLISFIIFIAGTISALPQNYNFLEYGVESGLTDNFIYNIIQDRNGYLWLGTGEGICRFDGIDFNTSFFGDTLPNVPVKESFIDSKGKVWFGFDNGQIAVLDKLRFRLINPGEEQTSAICGFSELSTGLILVATQNKGILTIDKDFGISQVNKGIENQLISSINITTDDILLLGSYEGLYMYEFQSNKEEFSLLKKFEELDYINVQAIKKFPDKYYIGTEDEGFFILRTDSENFRNYTLERMGENFNLSFLDVQDIYEDEQSNIWIGTGGDGVYKMNYSPESDSFVSVNNFSLSNGLVSNYIENIYHDTEGNFWFGSYGEGISVLKDQAFSFYHLDEDKYSPNVLSVLQADNHYWLGTETGILITDFSGEDPYELSLKNGLPNDLITSLYQDSRGTIWAGTSRNGIYKINPESRQAKRYFYSQNSLENSVNRITGLRDSVWVATNGGVLNFNIQNGRRSLLTMMEGLPHNKIRDIFIDSREQVWIATSSNGLFNITEKSKSLAIDAQAELEFMSIAEGRTGTIWAVTYGAGVFGFRDDSILYFSTQNGLRSNYCYSIMEDSNGNFWIGHRQGMSMLNTERTNVKPYSVEQGINSECNSNAIIKNNLNQLVFGTSDGVIFYDPAADKTDTLAPKLNIKSLKISDEDYNFSKAVYLPYGKYKIRIDWRGINLKNPESVLYQYKLEGYDDDWSDPLNQDFVVYSRIEDGKYKFKLKASDESGNWTTEPLVLVIEVKIPVWKAWWFILSLILILFISVYAIIKYRERKQRQIQEYLQSSLDQRTKEVREQAAEIENKNRDITDSINYAQRIQASILPPIGRLHNTFAGSFVFYQPRDIVSGDFYWYDKIDNNRFIIVCADSTGHGVPGAFMSMIGTTLIKDICSRKFVQSPSDILKTLDREIHEALNQNAEAEKSNDGMDIIVAEINLDTNFLRIASAMRPVILYINGEQTYVKGSRNSVGGRFDEESEKKSFADEGFQMQKGDLLYMFSDGYPDQFGGPLGKKFKMVRLKNLLRDIHDKHMDEQYSYIKSNFMLWKEDLEQVDDVLFMGIKF